MWTTFVFAVIIIAVVALFVCVAIKRFCVREVKDHVSLNFPLPPPAGDSDSMDETQYDVQIKTQRSPKQSAEEAGDVDVVVNGKQSTTEPSSTITKNFKVAERTCKEKEIRFLFEAPPPYDEPEAVMTASSGDRRRMVSMKLPELPSNADARVIQILRSKNVPLEKGVRMDPSTTEAGKPSSSSLTRLKHIPDTDSAVPATSTTQRSPSGTTSPATAPQAQTAYSTAISSSVTHVPNVSSIKVNENQQRENAVKSSVGTMFKMKKCQCRKTSNLSHNTLKCEDRECKAMSMTETTQRKNDFRNADDVGTRNS